MLQGIWAAALLRLAVVLGPATDGGKREGHRRETQPHARNHGEHRGHGRRSKTLAHGSNRVGYGAEGDKSGNWMEHLRSLGV